ncbi:MAG: sigma-70 family RNA polymerase sigma factor [Chloroflexi bacterium]|nr:MAG: sigma-70 family RNA polymerase sigma factor [Chloroflexota bacterium]
MFFFSVVIPGILPVRLRGTREEFQAGEKKVHAGMTAEKPSDADKQGVVMPSFQDDAGALSMLYEQFRGPIHSYIYRLLGNQEDADDVTQEVFVRACIAWDGLYERNRLSAWLYRIATNLCVDMLRRRKRIAWWPLNYHRLGDERFEVGASDDSSFQLHDSGGIPEIAERELIRHTLAKMPEEYAVALVLSVAQGIPYQEIATIVGISPNAAATRISRAKRMFAEQYQRLIREGVEKQENRR